MNKVDLNYNLVHDWLIELSDNKLSDNNLESELVENRSLLNQSFRTEPVREYVFGYCRKNPSSPLDRWVPGNSLGT